MSGHTPGPWITDQHAGWIIRPSGPSFDQIAGVQVSNCHNWKANARLIAAAPDLLAIASAYEAWEADLILNNPWSGKEGLPTLTRGQYERLIEIQTMRNSAIAKARGAHAEEGRT